MRAVLNFISSDISAEFLNAASVVLLKVFSLVSLTCSTASETLSVAETAVINLVSKNCSLDTRYFCVEFSNHKNCTVLSFKFLNFLSDVFVSKYVSQVQNLD